MIKMADSHAVIGMKQTLRALQAGAVETVYLADDADEPIRKKLREAARLAGATLVRVPTMKELGASCGIEVGAACCAIVRN